MFGRLLVKAKPVKCPVTTLDLPVEINMNGKIRYFFDRMTLNRKIQLEFLNKHARFHGHLCKKTPGRRRKNHRWKNLKN